VLASALAAKAEIFITGDKEILDLQEKPEDMRILSSREFWSLLAGKQGRRG
jgi:predicted nucleic acid-binding protein